MNTIHKLKGYLSYINQIKNDFLPRKINFSSWPKVIVETMRTRGGVGTEDLVEMMKGLNQWGWKISIDKRPYNSVDILFIHFRLVPGLDDYCNRIVKAKQNGIKIILYLIEPLIIRKEIFSQIYSINSLNKILDISDAIIVNSIGYAYLNKYIEFNFLVPYMEKMYLIEECLLQKVHGNLPRKIHETKTPQAVWHGNPHHLMRWVNGKWPDLKKFPAEFHPNLGSSSDSKFYGNLHECLEIPITTIARYDPIVKATIPHPGFKKIGSLLQRFDVGLAPFYTNTFITITKPLGLKLQTFFMAGLPVIASPVPDYVRWLEHEKTVLFADSKNEWKEMGNRMKDPKLRQYISDNARSLALCEFSPHKIYCKLEKLFISLFTGDKVSFRLMDLVNK